MKIMNYLPDTLEVKGIIYERAKIGTENENAIREAKYAGLKYFTIGVLEKRLKGKLNLHGKPYEPQQYIFVEVKNPPKVERFFNQNSMKDMIAVFSYSDFDKNYVSVFSIWKESLESKMSKLGYKSFNDSDVIHYWKRYA